MSAPLAQRFDDLWGSLSGIGRDPRSGGYHRFAWTAVDRQLRTWFAEQAERRGMAYEQDRNGNQWAWWGAAGAGAVVTGSHLDSVPNGGSYDGPLGVVSGFLAVDELTSKGVRPARPVAVVNCTDEEGARFGVACMGSRLLTGVIDADTARGLRDTDGVTLAQAMLEADADPDAIGRDDEALSRIGAFIELHVEQGRGLADLDAPVGVATAIWPHGRWRCSFHGEANHAGTTRLVDRRDPMLPFAATVQAARQVADDLGALATFGRAGIVPNGTNAIASTVDAWLDLRAPDEATLAKAVAEVSATAHDAGAAHGVAVEVTRESYSPVVEFSENLRDRITGVLGDVPSLPTGAGHDAGILSAQVPTGMLFVRNATGISHSPSEQAEASDCVAGARALAAVLEDLACR